MMNGTMRVVVDQVDEGEMDRIEQSLETAISSEAIEDFPSTVSIPDYVDSVLVTSAARKSAPAGGGNIVLGMALDDQAIQQQEQQAQDRPRRGWCLSGDLGDLVEQYPAPEMHMVAEDGRGVLLAINADMGGETIQVLARAHPSVLLHALLLGCPPLGVREMTIGIVDGRIDLPGEWLDRKGTVSVLAGDDGSWAVNWDDEEEGGGGVEIKLRGSLGIG